MRFLSSVALASTPRFRLAASCSAAEAMVVQHPRAADGPVGVGPRRATPGQARIRYHGRPARAASPRPGPTRTRRLPRSPSAERRTVIVPPAACTAATAAAEAPETVMVIARVISPCASSRTPANFRRSARCPASRSFASSIGCAASQPPALDRLVQRDEVERRVDLAERIDEAALRQAAVDRELAALEAVQRHARARLLALHAAARGLALAGADAAPERASTCAGRRGCRGFR